jgi:hypothetical protein
MGDWIDENAKSGAIGAPRGNRGLLREGSNGARVVPLDLSGPLRQVSENRVGFRCRSPSR